MPEVTVTEHLLLHQKKSPAATGQFTTLLNDLVLSAKIISRSVTKAGLLDVLGGTGEVNVQGELVQKLDEFANRVLIYRMERSGAVCAMASEENADIIKVPEKLHRGDYVLIFDPLDGSSNIDVNINVGTIFSILRRKFLPRTTCVSMMSCSPAMSRWPLATSSTGRRPCSCSVPGRAFTGSRWTPAWASSFCRIPT